MMNKDSRDSIDVVILCGGLGSRLGKLTKSTPKPMLKIGRVSFLDFVISYASSFGFKRFILCAGYKYEKIKRYYAELGNHREIVFSIEKQPLGTGGAVKNARRFIQSKEFLVMNGDSLCEIDLNNLLHFHKEKKSLLTIALAKMNNKGDKGSVELDKNRRIVNFSEKKLDSTARYANVGIYIFDESTFCYMPEGKFSLEYDFFPRLSNMNIYGYVVKKDIVDIGTPESLAKAQKRMRLG